MKIESWSLIVSKRIIWPRMTFQIYLTRLRSLRGRQDEDYLILVII